jgi:hypothetical protein
MRFRVCSSVRWALRAVVYIRQQRLREATMIKLELPYVTVLVDDRFRNRLADAGERMRVAVTDSRRHRDDGREQPHCAGIPAGRTHTQGRLR